MRKSNAPETLLQLIHTDCHVKKNTLYNKNLLNLISDFFTHKNNEFGYCNDYIFSGHSSFFILITLFIIHYQLLPSIFNLFIWILTIILTLIIVIGRHHYTIDVILAYMFTFSSYILYKNNM